MYSFMTVTQYGDTFRSPRRSVSYLRCRYIYIHTSKESIRVYLVLSLLPCAFTHYASSFQMCVAFSYDFLVITRNSWINVSSSWVMSKWLNCCHENLPPLKGYLMFFSASARSLHLHWNVTHMHGTKETFHQYFYILPSEYLEICM